MAGTIPLSMTQQFDIYGKPLAGGQLYIMVAGTVSTPQDAFQDTGLSIKMPYPMTLDAAGRVPQFFLADGTVKIRLQDKNGIVQLAADSVLVIGPSAGGGGGGATVDPTALIKTGQMILMYGTGALTGFVRVNGLTIGSSTSGASERANPDCQNCFLYLYGADPNLVVSGGRGANAAADWAANKNIALPDWRGYNISALDDMGNAAAGRLGGFFTNPTLLGSAGGAPSQQLSTGHLPPYTPSGTVSPSTAHISNNQSVAQGQAGTGITFYGPSGNQGVNPTTAPVDAPTLTFNPQGGLSVAFGLISPRKLLTIYMKL
jgi:hypothetical protein